jgi:hypothetical protein
MAIAGALPMLRTNTALWRITFLTGLGVLPGACGAQADVTSPEPGDTAAGPFAQPMPCLDSTPSLAAGLESELASGLEVCADGRVHRPAAVQCPSSVPRAALELSVSGTCNADSDCTEKPYGFCAVERVYVIGPIAGPQPPAHAECQYGCREDADCDSGFVCQCSDPVGRCVAATCQTDADCESGFLCSLTPRRGHDVCTIGVSWGVLSCETPADTCRLDTDCNRPDFSNGQECQLGAEGRRCEVLPACGRPFLVEGSARLAPATRSHDWLATSELAPASDQLCPTDRTELARAWTELGLMEHASVAAFARFTLQLLSLGAPATLVEESQQALADELLHARLCFSLASSYAGVAIGPGPLPSEHALDLTSLEDIAALTLHEGCVGETIAALEASEALALASDPAVRQVLARIEADERRHAALAWRFVSWALRTGGARVQRRIERELAGLQSSPPRPHRPAPRPEPERPSAISAHGILSAAQRAELRDAALRDVVLPCAHALLPAAGPAPLLSMNI